MARKKHVAHENHERWLVSYADFITLLFAFFVVMFASSQTDKGKAAQVSESVRQAMEGGHVIAAIAAVLGGTVDHKGQGNAQMKGPGGVNKVSEAKENEGLAELTPSLDVLRHELAHEIADGKMQVSLEARGLVVTLREAAFFGSGKATVNVDTYDSIAKVAQVIIKVPNPVRLEGHTDSVPIHNSEYRSNWELSAARSIAMIELFAGRFGVAEGRMSIGAYGDSAPIASNDTEEGRARNRRVDIVLLNQTGVDGEPAKAHARTKATRPAAAGGHH
jgi:chemotaxis protein MotB